MLKMIFGKSGRRKKEQIKGNASMPKHLEKQIKAIREETERARYIEVDGKKVDMMELIQRDLEKVNKERVQQGLSPYVNYKEWLYGDKDYFERNKPHAISEEEKAELCRMAGFEYKPKK